MSVNQAIQPETGADPVLYFDNVATSWPKSAEMIEAMIRYNAMIDGNPGRSGHHRSLDAGRIILDVHQAADPSCRRHACLECDGNDPAPCPGGYSIPDLMNSPQDVR